MTGHKANIAGHDYRQQKHYGAISGNNKAARITALLPTEQTDRLTRWADTLQVYSDYLIRY